MSYYVSAVPAYGRDYATAKQVKADWESGKDFLIQDLISGGYVNKDDKPPTMVLNIRYRKLTRVVTIP